MGEHQLCKLGVAGSSPARSISIHRRWRLLDVAAIRCAEHLPNSRRLQIEIERQGCLRRGARIQVPVALENEPRVAMP